MNVNLEKLLRDGLIEKVAPDKDDAPYVALAIQRNCAIWSNDKHLKQQMVVPVYSTAGLLRLFYRK